VADLTRTLLNEGATAGLVHRVEREVTAWLSTHIYSADLALGRFVQARRPGEALAGEGAPRTSRSRATGSGWPGGAAGC
jgi:hypothetical protein